jgi:hypothetical protein
MGFHRKYAYFLIISAKLCKEILHYEKALVLLRKAAPLYGLSLPNVEEEGDRAHTSPLFTSSPSDSPNTQLATATRHPTRRSHPVDTGIKYHELHGAILQQLITSAQELDGNVLSLPLLPLLSFVGADSSSFITLFVSQLCLNGIFSSDPISLRLTDPKQIILYSVSGLQKLQSNANDELLHKLRDNVLKMTKLITLHHLMQPDGLLLVHAVELYNG